MKNFWIYSFLFILIILPIFGHLDTLPFTIWDEARLAINAYEMNENGNFIVTYFEGQPDMWNTKPPFLIWVQVLFIKLLGFSELSMRLPSAFATLGTVSLLFFFVKKYLKEFWAPILVVLVLITSVGFVNNHAGRTADYDAMLTFFTTLAGVSLFTFTETNRNKYLYYFFGALTFACLTKGIAPLMFGPGFLLFLLWKKQVIPLLKNRHFYFSFMSFIIVVLGYYFIREAYNTGFLEAVNMNELGGRFNQTIEEHQHNGWFYFDNFMNDRIKWWYLLIPVGILLGFVTKNERLRTLLIFSTIISVSFFVVISMAGTKLKWYDVPLYPYLAILIGLSIFILIKYFEENPWFNEQLKWNIVPIAAVFLIFYLPYTDIHNITYKPKYKGFVKGFYSSSTYLQEIVKGQRNEDNIHIVHDDYSAHLDIYERMLADQGKNISILRFDEIKPGQRVVTQHGFIKEKIERDFNFSKEEINQSLTAYNLISKK